MKIDLKQIQKDIEPIIRKAGAILLSHFKSTLTVQTKNDGSIATNADIESERYLKQALRDCVPGVSFLAEESGKQGDSPYCFVIDPLDGTTNFSRSIGYFCVSVCLTYNNDPVLGVVYQPVQDDYFVARKDSGAYLNGVRLNLNNKVCLDQAVTVVGLPYTKDSIYSSLLSYSQAIAPRSFAFRYFGAAALDLAGVAAGRIDGLYLADLAWWDIAAGILLVKEAGGLATDFEGKLLAPDFLTCLAGSATVYAQLKELLQDSH